MTVSNGDKNISTEPATGTLADASHAAPILRLNATLVTDAKALERAIRVIVKADEIGFDIETTGYDPAYHPNGVQPPHGTIRTIQVALEEPDVRQYVIDCWRVDPTPLLDALFATPGKPWHQNPQRETVIHYAWFEAEWLAYHYGVTLGNVYDTCAAVRKLNAHAKAQHQKALKLKQKGREARSLFDEVPYEAAGHENQLPTDGLGKALAGTPDVSSGSAPDGLAVLGHAPFSKPLADAKLATVTQALLGIELDKGFQSRPWDNPRLTRGQVDYAALDAAVLVAIAPMLKEYCAAAGVTADVAGASAKPGKAGVYRKEKYGADEWSRHRVLRALKSAEGYDEAVTIARCLGQLPLRWDDRVALRKRAHERADELLGVTKSYEPIENDRRAYTRTPVLAA